MPLGTRTPSAPLAASVAQSWGPVGRLEIPEDHVTEALEADEVGGVATVTLTPAPVGSVLRVERISISTTSTQATTCSVYVGTVNAANLMDYSSNGNLDVADESHPILVPGGTPLTLQWNSMSPGSTASARVQYRRARVVKAPVSAPVGGYAGGLP